MASLALTVLAYAGAVTALAAGPLGAAAAEFDRINHAAGLLFVFSAAVLAGLVWRTVTQPRSSAAAKVCAAFATLVFGSAALPDWIASVSPPARVEATAPRLSIISYNLWINAPSQDAAIAFLAASDADFIVVQEAAGLWGPSYTPLREAYPFVIPSISAPYAYVAILSRRAPLTVNALAGAHYTLHGEGERPRHLRWADATFDVDGRIAHVVAFHGHRATVRQQRAQLAALARALRAAPDPAALIVAGDFNMTAATHSLRRFGADTGLSRATRALPTYPTPERGFPVAIAGIDHVFTGPGWVRIRASRGPNAGSDHYPIMAQLAAN
jgi:endonuclease/exonuclease/phosphatase (EEP) superfamily protein YafD